MNLSNIDLRQALDSVNALGTEYWYAIPAAIVGYTVQSSIRKNLCKPPVGEAKILREKMIKALLLPPGSWKHNENSGRWDCTCEEFNGLSLGSWGFSIHDEYVVEDIIGTWPFDSIGRKSRRLFRKKTRELLNSTKIADTKKCLETLGSPRKCCAKNAKI